MNEEVAAVMVEVVQGEEESYLLIYPFEKIETLCKKFGSLFIIDEVQTGIGRTGTLFAYEQMGIDPHIVTTRRLKWDSCRSNDWPERTRNVVHCRIARFNVWRKLCNGCSGSSIASK